MKSILALAIAASAVAPALAQTSVSIGINQPGVYGRINIGDVPRPALYSPQPVIIAPPPRVVVDRRPIYLYVPLAHQKDWRRYCNRYEACGQPVYFVRDEWVRERYEHDHPGWNRGRGHDKHDHEHGRGHDHDHDKGHGKGHDKGHGKKH